MPAGRFEVTHVESMAEAVRRLQNGDFDAVLLDLSLPDSRGLATVEQATALGARLPIIVLTGLNDEALATEAVRKGAQDFLLKDQRLDGPTLARTIRYAIERKRLETDLMTLNDTLERRVAERSEEARRLSHAAARAGGGTRPGRAARAPAAGADPARPRPAVDRRRADAIGHPRETAADRRRAGARSRTSTIRCARPSRPRARSRSSSARRSFTTPGWPRRSRWLARRMREKNRFTVELDADSEAEPVNEDVRLFLFEAVRELLFNAVKHSRRDPGPSAHGPRPERLDADRRRG